MVATRPVDFRKGAEGLAALVKGKRCFRPTFRIGVRLLMLCPNRASTYDDYRVYA